MSITWKLTSLISLAATIGLISAIDVFAATEKASLTPATSAPAPAAASTETEEQSEDADENGEDDEEVIKGPTKMERAQQWGDVNVAVRANVAARALRDGEFSQAQSAYRGLVGLAPNQEDFYLGLYFSSVKCDRWNHAHLALEELFEKKPEFKAKLAAEMIECLKKVNQSEDVPEYEALLKKSDKASFSLDSAIESLIEKSIFEEKKYKPKVFKMPERDAVKEEDVHIHSSRFGLTYLNMFKRSESIFIATYIGYEKGDRITFFKPPKATYKVEEILKGPPLNPRVPIRYEFHEKVDEPKPADWNFSESMMPKKGSKWILFIQNTIPIAGMFDTYHGSYGRQEYTEDNFDKILKIIEKHKGQTR